MAQLSYTESEVLNWLLKENRELSIKWANRLVVDHDAIIELSEICGKSFEMINLG